MNDHRTTKSEFMSIMKHKLENMLSFIKGESFRNLDLNMKMDNENVDKNAKRSLIGTENSIEPTKVCNNNDDNCDDTVDIEFEMTNSDSVNKTQKFNI